MSSKKLTDRQIKNIIAARAEGESLTTLAKKYKVSVNTIKNYSNSDVEFAKKCKQKKEENEKSVLEHMENKSKIVCEIVDVYLAALVDPERLKKSSPRDIATALGIIIDKFTKNTSSENTGETIKKQENLLNAIEKAVNGGNK